MQKTADKNMPETVSFSKDSTNIFFHILTKCNLSCRHCYIDPDQHGSNTLKLETITAWLDRFSDIFTRANIIFLGGEPTLHPDLAEAIKYAKAKKAKSITVDTNGYLFHDFLNAVDPSDIDFLSFSLDGATRKTNDAIRGKGSYEACVQGIKAAVSRGFTASLIYTVNRENKDELGLMAPLLSEWGIKRFFIQVIGLRGNSARKNSVRKNSVCENSVYEKTGSFSEKNLQLTKDEWRTIVPPAAENIAEHGIIVTYPKVFLDIDESFECAGNVADNYFIFPNGRVYRCPVCEDYPIHGLTFSENQLVETPKINETDLFKLEIPEGCVINKIVQPENLAYKKDGTPEYRVACCMLKQEITPRFNE